MRCAGFADEVSVDIDQQISALRALGWPGIEIRLVGKGRHFDDVTDAEFEVIREKLDRAGVQIVAYGSQIANWSRKISGSFGVDVAEFTRIMPRMRKTGTQFVRILSYPNDGWAERDWRAEVVRRLRELSRMAEANGIIVVATWLHFLEVKNRIPLKFGPETTTEVTCARVRFRVADRNGRTAEGWGETPLNVQWVWPSSLPYAVRHERLKAFCCRLAEAWAGFPETGHPVEVG